MKHPHRPSQQPLHAEEAAGIRGILRIVARRRGGPITARREVYNLITLAGRRLLVEALTRGIDNVKLAIAVGEGQSPPRVEDEALAEHLLSARVSDVALVPRGDGDSDSIRVRLQAELPRCAEGESQTIREAGLVITYGSGEGPVLFNRALFPALTRAADVDINLEWELTL